MITTSPWLVGRTKEFDVLRSAADRASAGSPVLVVVRGEAGIGKSRLVGEVAKELGEHRFRVLRGGCSGAAGRALPFGPWIQVLRALQEQRPDHGLPQAASVRDRVAELLGRLDGSATSTSTASSPGLLLSGITDVLLGTARGVPTLLVLEDIHWADAQSQATIDFLSRAMRRERLLIVVTARTDDPAFENVRPLLAELERIEPAVGVPLMRLTPLEVAEQVAGLERETDATALETIVRLSEGVPFYVEELVATGVDPEDGAPAVAQRLTGFRLAGLSPHARALVELAAAAFDEVPDLLLARATDLDADAYELVVAEAIGSGVLMLRGARRDGFGFRHALLREAALADLLPSARARLHRAWAEAWEATEERPGRAAALAHHWLAAGADAQALAACLAAAAEAGRIGAHAERHRLLSEAISLWPRVPEGGRPRGASRAGLMIDAAYVAEKGGQPGDASAHLAAARKLLTVDDWVRWAWLRLLESWLAGANHEGEYMRDLVHIIAELPEEPPDPRRAEACGRAAMRLAMVGEHGEARRLSKEGLEIARTLGDSDIIERQAGTAATVAAMCGDSAEADELLAEAISAREPTRDPWVQHGTFLACTMVTWLAGDTVAAATWAAEGAAALGGERPGPLRKSWAIQLSNVAESLMELGRWAEAEDALDRIAATGTLPDWVEGWNHRLRCQLYVWQGRTQGEPPPKRDGECRDPYLRPPCELQDRLPHCFTRLEAFAYARDIEGVRETAEILLPQPDLEACPPAYLYPSLAVIARVEADHAGPGTPEPRSEHLVSLVTDLLEAVPPWNDRDAAFAAQIRADILRRRGADDISVSLDVVQRWRDAQMLHHLGWALLRLGQASLASGDRPRATASFHESAELAHKMGACPLLDAVLAAARRGRVPMQPPGESTNPWGLTARELDVLQVLAEGATNAAIGHNLFISEKTVSVHVGHILAKLGVANRTQAADIARRAESPPSEEATGRFPLRRPRLSGGPPQRGRATS